MKAAMIWKSLCVECVVLKRQKLSNPYQILCRLKKSHILCFSYVLFFLFCQCKILLFRFNKHFGPHLPPYISPSQVAAPPRLHAYRPLWCVCLQPLLFFSTLHSLSLQTFSPFIHLPPSSFPTSLYCFFGFTSPLPCFLPSHHSLHYFSVALLVLSLNNLPSLSPLFLSHFLIPPPHPLIFLSPPLSSSWKCVLEKVSNH